jgi:hypothetical protein
MTISTRFVPSVAFTSWTDTRWPSGRITSRILTRSPRAHFDSQRRDRGGYPETEGVRAGPTVVDGLGLELGNWQIEHARAGAERAAKLAAKRGIKMPRDLWKVG